VSHNPNTTLVGEIVITIALTFGPMLLAIGEVVRNAA
jgi:hypothetical protein